MLVNVRCQRKSVNAWNLSVDTTKWRTDQVPAGVAHPAEEITTNDREDELGPRGSLGRGELKVEELDRQIHEGSAQSVCPKIAGTSVRGQRLTTLLVPDW